MLPFSFLPTPSRLAVSALNALLRREDWARERLGRHAGKTVRFALGGFSLGLTIDSEGLAAQADALAATYRQALAAIPQDSVPAELAPALHELDASAGSIRSAIAQSPDAGFLLGQLRRTYALRLELTRQGLDGAGLST